MDKMQLHELLEQLHAEMEKTEGVDENDRELLRDLMEHIQVVLEPSAPVPAHRYVSLGSRLGQSLQKFETSHPDLTMAIGRLLDNLANV